MLIFLFSASTCTVFYQFILDSINYLFLLHSICVHAYKFSFEKREQSILTALVFDIKNSLWFCILPELRYIVCEHIKHPVLNSHIGTNARIFFFSKP